MIVSVDDNLELLYMELKKGGYNVHKLSEKINSDAVIYSGWNTHIDSLGFISSSEYSTGVFLINGDNKNILDIDKILKTRVYSTLF